MIITLSFGMPARHQKRAARKQAPASIRERATQRAGTVPRAALSQIDRAMRVHPVVIVTGARQTGKSTVVAEVARRDGRPTLSLDDPSIRDRARLMPDDLLKSAPTVVIDEIQREPELVLALKRAVDAMGSRREAGRFLVTGSANLLAMRDVADSLVGRAAYVDLYPLTRRELLGLGETGIWSQLLKATPRQWPDMVQDQAVSRADWQSQTRLGGMPYPALHLADDDAREQWFTSYEAMYLERDLRELSDLENLPDFRRTMRAAALRIGNLLNQTEMGRDIQLSQSQVHRYLNLLQVSYQFVRLQAFVSNRTRRLIKAAKGYWIDTGLAMHVAGEREPRGAHFENLVLGDLLAWRAVQPRRPDVLYWRTAGGRELDFVIEDGPRLLPIEVKTAKDVTPRDIDPIKTFLADYRDRAPAGILLYQGERVFWMADRVLVAPWWKVI